MTLLVMMMIIKKPVNCHGYRCFGLMMSPGPVLGTVLDSAKLKVVGLCLQYTVVQIGLGSPRNNLKPSKKIIT